MKRRPRPNVTHSRAFKLIVDACAPDWIMVIRDTRRQHGVGLRAAIAILARLERAAGRATRQEEP